MFGDDDTGALLARLSSAWETANPRRASGGAHALSGFSFQFSVALLETLQRWRSLPGDRRAVPTVFVELLSDVVRASLDGSIVVTQVKRTQSPQAVRAGLEDLRSVYEVAAAEMPRDLSRIELELAFRTGSPEAAWPLIEAWVEEDADARAGMAEAISVSAYPDPENRIYALLVNKLNAAEPVACFHRWLGEMMAAAGQPTAADRRAHLDLCATQIWESLVELEKGANRHGGAYLWSPVDRLPDQVRPGDVLTGQQPSVAHLRKGCLAARPDALGRVHSRFERWLTERSKTEVLTNVPLFWIGGRSGSGKSAVLLQLLSALQEEGTGPVLWLSDKSELLADAARWARETFDSERPPIVGLDDPYAPNGPRDQVWGSFLAELTGALQDGKGEGVPILVSAGPTEQAEAFSRDFSSDFDIEVVELEREQPEEIARLRSWYEQRTGSEAPGPEDENVLLVQLFFEWRAGVRLDAFARRFQRRLQDADRETDGTSMVSILSEILALNRIYVGYPSTDMKERLSDQQADILRRLRDEEHIAIDEEGGRLGVWIAHPHLANEIYESWFPRDAAVNQRRGHFVAASLACLRGAERAGEKTAPVRAVMQALSSSGHILRDRIDPEFVKALPEIYDAAREVEPETPTDELRLWLEIQQLTGAPLDPDPVERVLLRIRPGLEEDPSATRLCETLLSSFERLDQSQRERLAAAIGELLAATRGWSGWPRVAAAAVQTHAMPEMADLVDEWLGERLVRFSSGWLLLATLEEYDEDPRFEQHAFRLLGERSRHPAWGRTWRALWQRRRSEELVELAVGWLKQSGPDRSWTFVWRALAGDGREEITKIGFDWLEGYTDHAGWSVVWDALWQERPSARLEALGLGWLESADVNREGFGIVWCRLWDSGLRDQVFRGQGEAALRRMSPERRSWGRILARLLREESTEESWRIGMAWVEAAEVRDRAWGVVLPSLLYEAYERGVETEADVVLQRGCKFLREAPADHPGWSHVFWAVWSIQSAGLGSLARAWLEEPTASRSGWPFVWERLWEDEPNEWLVDRAMLWLRDNARVRRWAHVWTSLREDASQISRSFDLKALLDLGEAWLGSIPASEPGWTYVFLSLWNQRSHDRVRRLAMDWLAATKSGYEPAWDRVWAALWEDTSHRAGDEGAPLRKLGTEWLECSYEHEHWTRVWCALWDYRRDSHLRDVAEHWVGHGGAGNPRRRLVIVRLAAEKSEKEESRAVPSQDRRESNPAAFSSLTHQISRKRTTDAISRGLDFVRKGPASGQKDDQLAWMRLWVALWKVGRTDELRQIAIDWLEAPAGTDARGRSRVWELLWKAEPSDVLYDLGCDYLEIAPHGRARWSTIWRQLWHYKETTTLHRFAVRWLDLRLEPSLEESQSPWPVVWLRVFQDDPTPELMDLGRRWLRSSPDDRAAPHVKRLLSGPPSPGEAEDSGAGFAGDG